jgi:hypothetical protein
MKKIVAAVFNSFYYESGVTLVASIHRNSYDSVDEIIIYDLGLAKQEIETLNQFAKVKVLRFPDVVNSYYEGYLEPKQFAYKLFVIKDAGNYGDLVFYLDAGAAVLRDLIQVYELIEKDDILLVQGVQDNLRWTHQRALELMNATEAEKHGNQISAGILGYKKDGKYQKMIDEAFTYSLNKEIVHGSHANHRHDQSIYSVLAIRYQCPVQSMQIYGGRSIAAPNQVIYVHRRAYVNHEELRLK